MVGEGAGSGIQAGTQNLTACSSFPLPPGSPRLPPRAAAMWGLCPHILPQSRHLSLSLSSTDLGENSFKPSSATTQLKEPWTSCFSFLSLTCSTRELLSMSQDCFEYLPSAQHVVGTCYIVAVMLTLGWGLSGSGHLCGICLALLCEVIIPHAFLAFPNLLPIILQMR